MAKNQNIAKDSTAIILMVAGIASIIGAATINGVLIVGAVGWFGVAQLNKFGVMINIFKANPEMFFIALALFFIGGGLVKVGTMLTK